MSFSNPFAAYRGSSGPPSGSAAARLDRELVESDPAIDISTVAGVLDEIFDPVTGDRWLPLFNSAVTPYGEGSNMLSTEQGLMVVRMMCRYLATENEYAINVIENRKSYIVSTGISFNLLPRPGVDPEEASVKKLAKDAKAVLDDELDRLNFVGTEEEAVGRYDRDGESLIRSFMLPDGVEFRFIEPRDLKNPGNDHDKSFGIQTMPEDVTVPVTYYVAGEAVSADQVYHLKANVDQNVKRGIPTLWAIRKNLHRAGKLLKAISMQAQFQGSIGAIRYHEQGDANTVRNFADARANYKVADPSTGQRRNVQKIDAGRVLDISSKIKMEFPSVGVGMDKLVIALQADLRGAASRLTFPEYWLTSDASNGNLASLLASDAPATRKLLRDQRVFGRYFADMADDVIEAKMRAGLLPLNTLKVLRIQPVLPNVTNLDPKVVAETNAILKQNGVKSSRTWAGELNLDYDKQKQDEAEDGAAAGTDRPPVEDKPKPKTDQNA